MTEKENFYIENLHPLFIGFLREYDVWERFIEIAVYPLSRDEMDAIIEVQNSEDLLGYDLWVMIEFLPIRDKLNDIIIKEWCNYLHSWQAL